MGDREHRRSGRKATRRTRTAVRRRGVSDEAGLAERIRKWLFGYEGVVLMVALALRLLYLLDSADNPSFGMPILDANTYHTLARNLAARGEWSGDFFWQAPFYPLFLSLCYKLFGVSVLGVKLLQAALGAITCVMTCRLATRIYDRRTGLVAGLICSLYVPLIYFESELLATGWAAFWSVLLLLMLLRYERAPGRANAVGLGVVGGLSAITRPVFFPFLWLAALVLALRTWRRERAAGPLAIQVVSLLAGFLLVAVPTASLNKRLTGSARIRPYTGGVNLYIGNHPDYEEMINTRPGMSWQALMDAPVKEGLTTPAERESYFLDRLRDNFRESPGAILAGLVRKSGEFVSGREIPRNTDIYLHRDWSLLLRAGLWRIGRWGFPFGLLLPFALWGLLCTGRRSPIWLPLFLLSYAGSVILVFVAARYRAPAVPVLCILAANGALCLKRGFADAAWKPLLALAVGAAITMASGSIPQDRIDYRAELYYYLGGGYNREGRAEEAEAAYRGALAQRPDYLEARINLGILYTRLGRLDPAQQQFEIALASHPGDPMLLANLAGVFYSRGDFQEAESLYRRALAEEPGVSLRLLNLGLCLLRQGKAEAARETLQEVLRLDPGNGQARQLLATLR